MLAFLTRRLSAAVLILLILSLVIFVLQHVSPGDPARAYVGANASPATVAAERAAARPERPVLHPVLPLSSAGCSPVISAARCAPANR